MALADRLRRLRGQTGAEAGTGEPAGEPPGETPGPSPPGRSLAERLRRARAGRDGPAAARTPDESALAETLGAERIAPGVLLLTRRLPPRLRHGHTLLGDLPSPSDLPWGERTAETDPQPPWLCLDTETSGLAGGTGTWAWLAGLLRRDDEGWVLRQYLLARLDAEPAYLEALAAGLAPPARLLTYNGRTFDAPLLATRFRLAGQPNPLLGLPHVDLLAPVRRAFARTWPDCRLARVEERLLGVRRTDDLPGAAAPVAWLGWLRRGESGPLARVLRHNRDDLLSLAGLLPALARVYADPGRFGADCRAVAAAHLAHGDLERALAILAANRRDLDPAGLFELAGLYRRTGDWQGALRIWEPLAAAGDHQARAALARYHEHRSGDLQRALALAESLPPGTGRDRRRDRLRAKLERSATNLSLGLPDADL